VPKRGRLLKYASDIKEIVFQVIRWSCLVKKLQMWDFKKYRRRRKRDKKK
jgi:hypothetical protein